MIVRTMIMRTRSCEPDHANHDHANHETTMPRRVAGHRNQQWLLGLDVEDLDLDLDAGRQVETGERVNGLW
jgi:hypothetical protein